VGLAGALLADALEQPVAISGGNSMASASDT